MSSHDSAIGISTLVSPRSSPPFKSCLCARALMTASTEPLERSVHEQQVVAAHNPTHEAYPVGPGILKWSTNRSLLRTVPFMLHGPWKYFSVSILNQRRTEVGTFSLRWSADRARYRIDQQRDEVP